MLGPKSGANPCGDLRFEKPGHEHCYVGALSVAAGAIQLRHVQWDLEARRRRARSRRHRNQREASSVDIGHPR
jgi:hypothetical protein